MKKNQGTFYKELAAMIGEDEKTVAKVLNGMEKYIIQEVKAGNTIGWTGTMTISPVRREARMGRNPQTGAALPIAAKNSVKIKAGKTLTEGVR